MVVPDTPHPDVVQLEDELQSKRKVATRIRLQCHTCTHLDASIPTTQQQQVSALQAQVAAKQRLLAQDPSVDTAKVHTGAPCVPGLAHLHQLTRAWAHHQMGKDLQSGIATVVKLLHR